MEAQLDQQKADEFAERLLGMLNSGALALMTSIGHRTGLFDTMAERGASTSSQLAEAAGLNERYVREWLGAMVTGGMVTYEPTTDTYTLPAEHAAFLTRAASPDNIAAFSQYIPLLGSVEDKVVDCFRNGGGVPYEAYGRFHQVMAEDSGQTVVAALLDHILPLVPGLKDRLASGIQVLDVGCGSGRALNLLAREFPQSRFTGFDISEAAIANARSQAAEQGLDNLRFEVVDASKIEDSEAYDLITAFDAVHDQADPAAVLAGISRALKADGTFLMQDIRASSHVHKNDDQPVAPFLYTLSCMHCMSVSLAQGGAGLGAMWGKEKALEMLGEAGFKNVDVHQLDHDFQNNFFVAKK